ncbi:ESPR-type extended signal peptide-containing protein [Burkholderia territorii]|uniref:ESPR-type extended signal peptide-containing protein n=1 Tax=Burkholderia territorii TaxID=1503055 RepID=UPI00075CC0A2|nr:ESPR-type extended signal peptide-containing protein [Burkholderia territorii]KWE32924.1 transporter [Burkholderia territorii]KWE46918.1 transporter [Burkholderia territorii]KWE47165.1 transporter [Burkholderia territorii]
MNKTYRNIWNAATGTWAAVAETAKAHGKGVSRAAPQAVVALAVAGTSIGGAFAADSATTADTCTTPSGQSGTLNAAGTCTSTSITPSPGSPGIGVLNVVDSGGSGIAITHGSNAPATATGNGDIAIGGLAVANGGGTAWALAVGDVAKATGSKSVAVGNLASASGASSTALGASAGVSAANAVALGASSAANRANTVSVGSNVSGSAFTRQIVNVGAGTAATDAVNVAQLTPVVTALGGGASIDATTGAVTAPTYTLANGGTQTTVGGALGALDDGLTIAKGDIAKNASAITTINNQLTDLSDGTLGLVQQAGAGADITVAKDTDGAAVNFSGTAGDRTLAGVAAGAVSATSHEAINGSQLHGVSTSIASAIGGNSTVNPDGSISAPTFTVGDGKGGTTTVHTVGDVVANIDDRVTTNEGDITKLTDQIGSGTVGLVQQAGAGADITVAKDTDGAAVNFSGTAGDRTLAGVAAGAVSATSHEAINGSQLHGVSTSIASAIGGNSTVNPDGSISAPTFTVGDGKGGTTTVHTVGDVVANIDDRVTTNEGDITKLGDQIASGEIGLVRQDPTTSAIMVGANVGGSTVNFAGTGGPRTLSGVANGVNDDDAVTIAQLKATGLIDYTGKEIAAVTYDDIQLGSVTFGGASGTVLHNVAAGQVAAGSMDAVNGGQLYATQQEFASRFAGLDDRVSGLETGGVPGSPGNSPGGFDPSGSGDGSVQVGSGSTASGDRSTAIGQDSSATASNSVAIGAGSVADRPNTVSVGSAGNERQITNVADGTAPTDAVNVRQMEQRFGDTNRMIDDVAKNSYAGIAAAMAMPNLTPSQPGKTVVAAGAANYKGGSAVAAGATYRTRDGKWLMNGAVSVTSTGDAGVRAQVGYEF